MPRPPLLYRFPALLARAALPLAAPVVPRLRQMRAERKELLSQVARAGAHRPTVLLHAASAGELRQLEPVIRRLRAARPGTRIAITWFSTSGALVGRSLGADIVGALPWDTPWETGALLERLKPSLIVIGKLDLWPELEWQAEQRGIPVALAAATVRWNSSRLRWPTRGVLESAYASLAAVGAISEDDATRLVQLGVPRSRITITGDPRHDSVLERLASAAPVARDPSLLVAGSTWEVDEVLLIHSLAEVRKSRPDARLLVVPHQPTPAVFDRITRLARERKLPAPVARTSATAADPLIVDMEIGGLALTYRLGSMAYVGGGFNLSGPHSVLEPAATGVPVAIGPLSTSHEALRLEGIGGLVRLDADGAMNEMPRLWLSWLENESARASAGEAARAVVHREAGASDRTVALALGLIS